MPLPFRPSGLARLVLATALVAQIGAMAASSATPVTPAAATGAGTTPLVLKDGRIARVGIFAVDFARGSAEPEGPAAQALDELIASIATDCFLTAQAIGHVAPDEAKGQDPLASHRLARARADRVQALMTGKGLAQNAIASVWDWQFQIAQPRVTLWVFQLAAGEDCQGQPLVAAATPGLQSPPMAMPASAGAPPPTGAGALPAPIPAAPPAVAPAAAPATPPLPEPAPASPPPLTQAPPAAEAAEEPAPAAAAPLARLETQESAQPAAGQPLAARIVFAPNSSYFTPEEGSQLRGLVAGLPEREQARLVLTVAVGGAQDIEAKSPDAQRYNRWLAERRAARIADWLRRQARGRALEIDTRYRPDDGSRAAELTLATAAP